MSGPRSDAPDSQGGDLCTILQANFHEKALFVKSTWRLLAVERNDSVSFVMLPFALSVSPLLSDSVHYEIRLGSD
jgi:hypothetical protein